MCGIAGIVLRDRNQSVDLDALNRMADAIKHRGPDGSGLMHLSHVGLSHRRLSILDLSENGTQPMSSQDGVHTLVFNGEIYNYKSLIADLSPGLALKSGTDTEVLLYHLRAHKLGSFEALDGMFAFAFYDRHDQSLLAARDHFGIKPFYYYFDEEKFIFGSEIKAIHASGLIDSTIDKGALNDFFDFNWIPAPRTIFKGIKKLRPASFLKLDIRKWHVETCRYWTPTYNPRSNVSCDEIVDEARARLSATVQLQKAADVEVGTFLSGGIDSSLVTLFASQQDQTTRAFTIGFDDDQFSEVKFAEEIARALHISHTIKTVSPFNLLSELDTLAYFYDEPFADTSMIPTYHLCEHASKHVKVCLSGDGGDELFSGYRHHHTASKLSMISHGRRPWLNYLARNYTDPSSRLHRWLRRLSYSRDQFPLSIIRLPSDESRLSLLSTEWRETDDERHWIFSEYEMPDPRLPVVTRTQLIDLDFYLPNDMLVKMDRASMANGLEVRVPFLTKSLCEFAFSIPDNVRYKKNESKRILRGLVRKLLGSSHADRKKQGFAIPESSWSRSLTVKESRESLMSGSLASSGVLDMRQVAHLFDDVTKGSPWLQASRSAEVFSLFVMNAWWNRFVEHTITQG